MLDGYFYQNEPITPDSAALKRKLALAMQAKGMDFSPVRSGWEGAARMAQALAGALDERMIDAREADAQKKANDQFSQGLGAALGGGASQAPAIPATTSGSSSSLDGDMGKFASAIANIESKGSGDYNAIGPATAKGDRAYGKYQVMGDNIPQWTQEALGKPMTPQEFLANPQAQDAVFQHRFGGYLKKTGSPADAASMWFTGRPLADAQNARDVNGTTGGQYVSKFLAGLPLDRSAVASNIDFGGTVTPQQAAVQPGQRGALPTSGDINYGGDVAAADAPAARATAVQYQPPGQAASAAGGAPAPAQNPYSGQVPWAMSVLNNPYSTQAQKMIAQSVLQKAMTSPESFDTFKTEDGDWVQRNRSTGQLTMLKQAPNREQWHREGNVQVSESGKAEAYPDQTPEASKKLNDALTNWKQYHLPDPSDPKNGAFWQDFGSKVMGGAGQTINNTVQNATNPILEGLSTQFAKSREDAQGAADTVRSLHSARQQLEGGIIAGAGADQRLALQKVGALLGVADPSSIVNTETFRTQLKPVVLSTVKGLGAGSGISNADRDFALEAVGGSINLDEKTISRVLDITERAARAKIDRFNKQSQKMLETQPTLSAVLPMMTVDQPEEYQPQAPNSGIAAPVNGGGVIPGSTAQPIPSQPQKSGGPLQAARDAISRGAPRDKVIERLKANGIDPSGL